MRNTKTIKELSVIEDAVLHYAKKFNRILPEIRFFELNSDEFMCLLEKGVYPVSPPSLWEGQDIVKRKQRVREGLESSIYYEVVQTGDPSYAYLNHGNSPTTQASVMAHVIGHCEFSERNVMKDSEKWRSERVIYLSKRVEYARERMGNKSYLNFWNASHSMLPFVNSNSKWNLDRTVETETNSLNKERLVPEKDRAKTTFVPFSSTMNDLFNTTDAKKVSRDLERKKEDNENISRSGYNLKFPCQDIFGFLTQHAPLSNAEREIMNYQYFIHKHYDFVRRTQIMNEGWAMYWEQKIMMELFRDDVVDEVIDYAHKFQGVLHPRPFFQRNPYHLGYNMWHDIQKEYEEGKITSEYRNEKSLLVKENWNKKPEGDSLEFLENIVETCTDYEFLRRHLTLERVSRFHLNRIPNYYGIQVSPNEIVKKDDYNTWIDPQVCRDYMLDWFDGYYQPQIFIVNTDFNNNGLLLFHKHTGKNLKESWIKPTLKNISKVWHSDVHIMSGEVIYSMNGNSYSASKLNKEWTFDLILELMQAGEKVEP